MTIGDAHRLAATTPLAPEGGSAEPPDVTVVTPTFRRERQVVEAVRSALAQDGVTIEVIVIDDSAESSARGAIEAIADPRVRYIPCEVPSGGHPAAVRNRGATLARGRYIHFLDDDDRLADGALKALVGALDAEARAGVAFGQVVPFGDDAEALAHNRRFFARAARMARRTRRSRRLAAAVILFRGTMLVNSACMIRREHVAALGGYDEQMPLVEDVDFYMRAIRRFGHVYLDRPVLHYRTGAPSLMNNANSDADPVLESYRSIYRRYKARYGAFEFLALKAVAKLVLR